MPLPFILGAAAAVAAAAGIGSGVHGAVKMKEANDTMQSTDARHKKNLARFEKQNKLTNQEMDKLGTLELNILKSFEDFSNTFEKIKNRPQFKQYEKEGVTIPEYNGEKLKEVSIGAGVLLGGIGGAAVGTAGGFAAAGATTAAVMALGTASTGTAIASLSGVAATNAALAVLGGGTLAAGGGGIALGSTILGASTLGVGLLIGGVIFNIAGSSLSSKADEAWSQMKKAEAKIDEICDYMMNLSATAHRYNESLSKVNNIYQSHLTKLKQIVSTSSPVDWNHFSEDDKLTTENTVLLVGLLYEMCKVKLVLKTPKDDEVNVVNRTSIDHSIQNANKFLAENHFNTTSTIAATNLSAAVSSPFFSFDVIHAISVGDHLLRVRIKLTKGTLKLGKSCTFSGINKSAVVEQIGFGKQYTEVEAVKVVEILLKGDFTSAEVMNKTFTQL